MTSTVKFVLKRIKSIDFLYVYIPVIANSLGGAGPSVLPFG